MKYRKLGKYGAKVSEVSLGAWLTYGGSVEEQTAIKCIHTALENKINFIDVADVYARGQAERVVGKALSYHRIGTIEGLKLDYRLYCLFISIL